MAAATQRRRSTPQPQGPRGPRPPRSRQGGGGFKQWAAQHRVLVFAGAAVLAYLAYRYYENNIAGSGSSTATPASGTDTSSPASTDNGSSGDGGGSGSGDTTSTPPQLAGPGLGSALLDALLGAEAQNAQLNAELAAGAQPNPNPAAPNPSVPSNGGAVVAGSPAAANNLSSELLAANPGSTAVETPFADTITPSARVRAEPVTVGRADVPTPPSGSEVHSAQTVRTHAAGSVAASSSAKAASRSLAHKAEVTGAG